MSHELQELNRTVLQWFQTQQSRWTHRNAILLCDQLYACLQWKRWYSDVMEMYGISYGLLPMLLEHDNFVKEMPALASAVIVTIR